MLSKKDIELIIDACRKAAENGLGNGNKATIQQLTVDFLKPPMDFLGVGNNPAIFVNQSTHSLLGRFHQHWELNKTIAVKEDFLSNEAITVIGVITHETGHAFNVAANIENSEANAYVFEIEIMSLWFKSKTPPLFDALACDLQSYFATRLPYYRKESKYHHYLAKLVAEIEQDNATNKSASFSPETKMDSPRLVVPTPTFLDLKPTAFFKNETDEQTRTPVEEKPTVHDDCVIS